MMSTKVYTVTYAGGTFETDAFGARAIADAVEQAIDSNETIVVNIHATNTEAHLRIVVGRGIPIMIEMPD